ncbi:hypothetical protein [Streptomyces sp. NPDC005209]|uniref:hypothetical protein n=1 Tax=Streptomyces sp. NPDC005209 TaxID=3156715 RepID=UPI0033ABB48A
MMSVKKVLAQAFVSIAVSIDLADDEEIDPDVAVGLLEPAAAFFRGLTEEGRREVSSLILECAEQEEDPERRSVILELPEAIGVADWS